MQKFKKYLGAVIDGMIIEDIDRYYDFSTDRVEYCFIIKDYGMGINCDLFISKHFA